MGSAHRRSACRFLLSVVVWLEISGLGSMALPQEIRSVGSSTFGSLDGPRGVWSSVMSMRDRQLHEDHHSNDRDASRRYVQMTDEVHLEETDASGSRDSPCRAVFLRPLPKLPPHVGALSSNELPAKPTRRPTEGHDQMGEWIQPSPDSCVYCYRNAIHLTPLCDAFPLEGIPVSLCYCIGKIYKKMHYMVGYDGCLHEACGRSLDSPPVYNPLHLRPSMVRVCRACFSLPLEAAKLHPEFDL